MTNGFSFWGGNPIFQGQIALKLTFKITLQIINKRAGIFRSFIY